MCYEFSSSLKFFYLITQQNIVRRIKPMIYVIEKNILVAFLPYAVKASLYKHICIHITHFIVCHFAQMF